MHTAETAPSSSVTIRCSSFSPPLPVRPFALSPFCHFRPDGDMTHVLIPFCSSNNRVPQFDHSRGFRFGDKSQVNERESLAWSASSLVRPPPSRCSPHTWYQTSRLCSLVGMQTSTREFRVFFSGFSDRTSGPAAPKKRHGSIFVLWRHGFVASWLHPFVAPWLRGSVASLLRCSVTIVGADGRDRNGGGGPAPWRRVLRRRGGRASQQSAPSHARTSSSSSRAGGPGFCYSRGACSAQRGAQVGSFG